MHFIDPVRRVRGTLVLAALAGAACAPAAPPTAAPAPVARDTAVAAAPTAPANSSAALLPRTDTVRARPFDTGRMWTFDFPPLDYLQQTYGFRPSQQWLDNARMGALRFASWCSASFVSPTGLVLTNHHCAVPTFDPIQQPGEDVLSNGFIASSRAQERRVPNLFVEQLVSIEDVSAQMMAPLQSGSRQEQLAAQAQVRQQLTQSSDPKLRYQIVEFYNGGRYARYGYRRYDDVRLVFAPEQQMAFFGGDPDNFTYPRYALDFALYRVYDENGQPLRPTHHFRFNPQGAQEGDPVFVVGNPGSTQRQHTLAQLEFLRDVQYPAQLTILQARMDLIRRIMRENPERGKELRDDFFSLSNSHKAISGRLDGLRDPFLFARKVDFERNFRAAVAARPELQQRYGALWDSLAAVQQERARIAPRLTYSQYLNAGPLGTSLLLLRALDAPAMKEPALIADTRSPAEVQQELELLLRIAQERLGADDPILRAVLAGRTPEVAARELVSGFTLADTAARQQFLTGGAAGAEASTDPVIRVARQLMPLVMELQMQSQALNQREQVARNALGRAFYEIYGTDVPPDATFTLRLADGVVKGYEAGGTLNPPHTTFYGLYNRYNGFGRGENPDFALPRRWQTPPRGLDLETPYNFVSTNDIIGGNSGSPMLSKDLEVVGLIFDGNVQSLPGSFIFDETQNRTVSVHAAAIIETLRDVYGLRALVAELLSAPR